MPFRLQFEQVFGRTLFYPLVVDKKEFVTFVVDVPIAGNVLMSRVSIVDVIADEDFRVTSFGIDEFDANRRTFEVMVGKFRGECFGLFVVDVEFTKCDCISENIHNLFGKVGKHRCMISSRVRRFEVHVPFLLLV